MQMSVQTQDPGTRTASSTQKPLHLGFKRPTIIPNPHPYDIRSSNRLDLRPPRHLARPSSQAAPAPCELGGRLNGRRPLLLADRDGFGNDIANGLALRVRAGLGRSS